MDERLQKILSQWGIASRRQAETLIREGRVYLNGQVARLGQKADPAVDQIAVDGTPIRLTHRPQSLYLLLNKPVGYVSTCHDPQGRLTVLDLLPVNWRETQGLHPVGRLDMESTGALLITNDGVLTFRLTHPRYHIPKTYHVWVQGQPPITALQQWREGTVLGGRKTLPAGVRLLRQRANGQTCLEVILREGRNRQIRRVAEQLGFPVIQLHRVTIGPICLGSLPRGGYRLLETFEIELLRQQVQPPLFPPALETAVIAEERRL